MTLLEKNRMAIRVALGLAISGLVLWCASAVMGGKPSDRCPKSPDGLHDYMVGGDGAWECFFCERPKPK